MVKSLNAGLLSLNVIVMIVCNETSRATAFDFYDGVSVFWIKHFILVQVFCFISLFNTAFSYSTAWLDFVLM
jgi:hypothetical protein